MKVCTLRDMMLQLVEEGEENSIITYKGNKIELSDFYLLKKADDYIAGGSLAKLYNEAEKDFK